MSISLNLETFWVLKTFFWLLMVEVHHLAQRWCPSASNAVLWSFLPSCEGLWPLTSVVLLCRENDRHRQSAEAGSREGLNAAAPACMEFLHPLPGGETAPDPTATLSLCLKTQHYWREEEERGGGEESCHVKKKKTRLNQFLWTL